MNQEILDVAHRCARRYKARVWWADLADLQQEAALAALRASRTWDVQCGVPFAAYAWRACALALRRWCWRMSAPVSEADHHLPTLRGVHGAPLDELSGGEDPHSLLEQKQHADATRAQVDYVLSKLGNGAEAAARVIVHEEPPALVAHALGVSAAHVYRDVRRGRERLANNAVLYNLWRES